MTRVIGVRFKQTGKIYYFSPGELDLHEGDYEMCIRDRSTSHSGTVTATPRFS